MIHHTATLPPETWLLVIESLFHSLLPSVPPITMSDSRIARSPRAILNLCLVSRGFHQLADKFRFQEIHVAMKESSPRKMACIQGFLRLLEVRHEVKAWVKTFEAGIYPGIVWSRPLDYAEYTAVLPRIKSLIPELRNLRSLRCGLTVLTPYLYSNILRLETLETLDLNLDQLDSEAVNVDHPLDRSANPPICPLRRLDISGEMEDKGATVSAILALIRLGTLTELKYWARVMPETARGITLFQAIKECIPNHIFSGLRYLEVVMPESGANAQWFLHLGERCPNLVELRVHRNFIEHPFDFALWLGDQVTERHFPSLLRFAGPLALAPIFAQNRPVYSVGTSLHPFGIGPDDPTIPVNAIRSLKPSVPIRVLDLFAPRWNDDDIEAVAHHHPQVEQFTYSCIEGRSLFILISRSGFSMAAQRRPPRVLRWAKFNPNREKAKGHAAPSHSPKGATGSTP
ncbi:hypothetical protein FRC01_003840 [Tulasnella sp. 417]|nr:hypothetical protein FRC01_003840 [Tulasnella sp. 417]